MEVNNFGTSPPPTKTIYKLALEGPFKVDDERCKLFTKKGYFNDPDNGKMVSVEIPSPKWKKN